MKDYKNIILVDDNETALFLNTDVISEVWQGVNVVSFSNAQEFIDECLEDQKWHSESSLVLLDINMPGKVGFDILEELEDQRDGDFGELEFVMVTSSNLKRDIEISTRFESVLGYITKPLTKEKLIETLYDREMSLKF